MNLLTVSQGNNNYPKVHESISKYYGEDVNESNKNQYDQNSRVSTNTTLVSITFIWMYAYHIL